MADELAGMDEEGLRKVVGELLAANRATQANFDEIRQQFPLRPSHLSNDVPTWEELEEGGLEPPGEGGSFDEQLGVEEGFADVIWAEVKADGAILAGGDGLTIERASKGIYKIWLQGSNDFDYPGSIRSCTPSTAGLQAVNANVNLIESKGGVKGYEIVLVENVAGTTYVDADFHFFAANLSAE